MMNEIIILSTASSKKESEQIAIKLVENELAACVNILPNITSIYSWQNKVHLDREFMMVIKTIRRNETQVYKYIIDMHSYDTPEIITVDVNNIDKKYAKWLNSVIKTDNDKS